MQVTVIPRFRVRNRSSASVRIAQVPFRANRLTLGIPGTSPARSRRPPGAELIRVSQRHRYLLTQTYSILFYLYQALLDDDLHDPAV